MIADIARLSLNKVRVLSRKLTCADCMKNEKYADFDFFEYIADETKGVERRGRSAPAPLV
ncbi:MAG TPA: hypothetical protein H9756_00395 [Candidatus Mediterraneibacter gallistercoris]|uniref:Uncharacterized protein n=1 Tax=Candidatus Mediterraneibacter gallistercoris TaxID=2838671 RepID=A0A9D2P4B7_9FIRM|nr:hypothetical protein [Candidatus Mediterraneibacter gallistercoris]